MDEVTLFPGLERSVSPELMGCEGPEPDPEPISSPSEESDVSPLKGAERIWLALCGEKKRRVPLGLFWRRTHKDLISHH
jgi:hypothetical protein